MFLFRKIINFILYYIHINTNSTKYILNEKDEFMDYYNENKIEIKK